MSAASSPAGRPYVSIAFTNRNDNYGGDLDHRIAIFIAYYARYVRRWPDLLEFVICDWNPPDDRPRLRDAFDWSPLGRVVHVEVPPASHARIAGTRGRKMLDYIGRNVAIRRGSAPFTLVLNQDILVSASIMEVIARRALSPRMFYRADRCDFELEPCRAVDPADIEGPAAAHVFAVHRRHRPGDTQISPDAGITDLAAQGTRLEEGDVLDPGNNIIWCRAAGRRRSRDRLLGRAWRSLPFLRGPLAAWHAFAGRDSYHRVFLLHTNASGDFILAPRAAFERIHGLWETVEIYMHLDTYAIVQLFAAGYDQAVFRQPHRVLHADHDRSARSSFVEGMSWPEHEAVLSAILRGDRPYRLNPEGWGLAAEALPTHPAHS